MIKRSIIALVLVTTLTGCLPNTGPKQASGSILGGAAGALIGSQFGKGKGQLVGVALGALAGSYLGSMVGQKMDERDRQMAEETMICALEQAPDHQVRTWRNPNNNHAGKVKVTRTEERKRDHLVCREYVHTVMIDGQQEQVHGRACRDTRDPNGVWRAQN